MTEAQESGLEEKFLNFSWSENFLKFWLSRKKFEKIRGHGTNNESCQNETYINQNLFLLI